jgi:3-dehydroquinate synthase
MTTPGGEQAKNGWNTIRNIMTQIGNAHLDRHCYVITVGGGSVLDGVGFAASIVHRGIRMIRVPTTVLAQNDAGVGVKTGMDERGIKNFVGTFAPPFAVLSDFDFLPTLKDKYWFGGIAESFKVAIIKDRMFFEELEANADMLRQRDAEAMESLIMRTAELHLEHIREGGDPVEMGAARPLDFGHWAAHKIEVLSNYRLGHGQAVAVGIALDSFYAAEVGLLSMEEARRIASAMMRVGLAVWDSTLEMRDDCGRLLFLRGLDEFREHLGGELTITLPDGIGARVEVHKVDKDLLVCALRNVREICCSGAAADGVLSSQQHAL